MQEKNSKTTPGLWVLRTAHSSPALPLKRRTLNGRRARTVPWCVIAQLFRPRPGALRQPERPISDGRNESFVATSALRTTERKDDAALHSHPKPTREMLDGKRVTRRRLKHSYSLLYNLCETIRRAVIKPRFVSRSPLKSAVSGGGCRSCEHGGRCSLRPPASVDGGASMLRVKHNEVRSSHSALAGGGDRHDRRGADAVRRPRAQCPWASRG